MPPDPTPRPGALLGWSLISTLAHKSPTCRWEQRQGPQCCWRDGSGLVWPLMWLLVGEDARATANVTATEKGPGPWADEGAAEKQVEDAHPELALPLPVPPTHCIPTCLSLQMPTVHVCIKTQGHAFASRKSAHSCPFWCVFLCMYVSLGEHWWGEGGDLRKKIWIHLSRLFKNYWRVYLAFLYIKHPLKEGPDWKATCVALDPGNSEGAVGDAAEWAMSSSSCSLIPLPRGLPCHRPCSSHRHMTLPASLASAERTRSGSLTPKGNQRCWPGGGSGPDVVRPYRATQSPRQMEVMGQQKQRSCRPSGLQGRKRS